MKIERPIWNMITKANQHHDRLNMWFNDFVDPVNNILSAGVEIKGYHDKKAKSEFEFISDWDSCFTPTHKALLINIQPIKQQTREKKLEEFVELIASGRLYSVVDKAKALLDSKE